MQGPDEIDDILKKAFEPATEGAATFHHEVDITGVDLGDNSEEQALVRDDAKRDGVHVPELPDEKPAEPIDSSFDSDPVKDAKTIIYEAFSTDFDFTKIEVDVIERDRFYRCGLHDEQMHYIVEVPGSGLTVKVVIPPTSKSEATLAALDQWVRDKFIGSNSIQYLHGFQLLTVWLMVREVNGVPTEWFEKAEAEVEGGKLSYRKLRDLLCHPDTVDEIREINEVRWSALSLAIRIADHKHALCLEALRSRKVFTTAGSV